MSFQHLSLTKLSIYFATLYTSVQCSVFGGVLFAVIHSIQHSIRCRILCIELVKEANCIVSPDYIPLVQTQKCDTGRLSA